MLSNERTMKSTTNTYIFEYIFLARYSRINKIIDQTKEEKAKEERKEAIPILLTSTYSRFLKQRRPFNHTPF